MITIRPNLNNSLITVHRNRLGKVLKYTDEIFLDCTGTVVRKTGNEQLKQGKHKTVHAGLCGHEIDPFDLIRTQRHLIKYNIKKACFTVKGQTFTEGLVYMKNHKAYLIKG
jgi:hypothetical protein